MSPRIPLRVAVVGSGAAGLAAAWLLAREHHVTLVEKDDRLGGHAHTAFADPTGSGPVVPIDTGFIVYNESCYPNLVRWFKALGIASADSDMSFAVSRDDGGFEYAGGPPLGLVAQPSLLFRPRFWSMLRGLLRFYREARERVPEDSGLTLGEYLDREQYPAAFIEDHLMPFAAAVWSGPATRMRDYPAAAFIRFCDNHGLLQIADRPQWRTVSGGSHRYVDAVAEAIGRDACLTGFDVTRIARRPDGVSIDAADGRCLDVDHVVVATHANHALACLDDPHAEEQALLSVFGYESNRAVLHTDSRLMPKRRRAWCSWNYVETVGRNDREQEAGSCISVSYWMNRLQPLATDTDYFVTINPDPMPVGDTIVREARYEHPVFNAETWAAQQRLWSLQGRRRTWFCGAYFGAGFHEDAVQAGLAVAEQLGGTERPWQLDEPSGRIVIDRVGIARPAVAA